MRRGRDKEQLALWPERDILQQIRDEPSHQRAAELWVKYLKAIRKWAT